MTAQTKVAVEAETAARAAAAAANAEAQQCLDLAKRAAQVPWLLLQMYYYLSMCHGSSLMCRFLHATATATECHVYSVLQAGATTSYTVLSLTSQHLDMHGTLVDVLPCSNCGRSATSGLQPVTHFWNAAPPPG